MEPARVPTAPARGAGDCGADAFVAASEPSCDRGPLAATAAAGYPRGDPMTPLPVPTRSVALVRLRPPPVRSGVFARPRLDARFEAAVGRRVTLLAAPAGYGKTTALAGWARRRVAPPVWWSLEPGDAEADRFVRGLWAALGHAFPDRLRPPDTPDAQLLLEALLDAIEGLDPPVVVVLDDVHAIAASAAALATLRTLVDHAPAGLRVVIATRVEPQLPFARWRLDGALDEVGVDDLRFEVEEASGLLRGLDVPLTSADVATLVRRTEGWGAGLQLAALGLRGRSSDDVGDFVERFTGTDPYVLAYLTEEVLQRLDPATQDFLLVTSVPDEIDVATAALLSGRPDAADRLLALERANLFLTVVDAATRRYRYHGSFRDLLRRRLEDAHPALAAELRERVHVAHGGPAVAMPTPGRDALSDRERDVLRWLATGAANKAIAARLDVSPNTVKSHVKHLFEKLGVSTRTAAVARARELDWM